MVLEIPLQQVPNQTFGVTIQGSTYELTLNSRLGDMYLSVVKDNQPVIIIEYARTITRLVSSFLPIYQEQKTPFIQGFLFLQYQQIQTAQSGYCPDKCDYK